MPDKKEKIKREISHSTYSILNQKPLTLKDISEAIDNLTNQNYCPEPQIKLIEFSNCKRFVDILKNLTPKKIKEKIGKISLLYGIPILKRNYVPKNEIWFRDNNGMLIKRFKFN